jgi:MmyB-like transcription regulator ligand binding domain
LISELSLSDAEFRTWWAERHVNYTMAGTRTYTHPLTGPYTLDWEMLHVAEDDQILMVMTAPPDTPAQAALRRLGSSQAEIRVDERSGSPIRSTAEHRDGSSSRRSTRQRSAIGQPEPTVH